MILPTIRFRKGAAEIIDQTLLPGEYRVIRLTTVDQVCEAIRSLRIRGAPALGVAGAYGLLVAVEERFAGAGGHIFDDGIDETGTPSVDAGPLPSNITSDDIVEHLDDSKRILAATRPTAVNLSWALERMARSYRRQMASPAQLLETLVEEAVSIYREDIDMCRALGRHGSTLIAEGDAVLTHCNTGGLATAGFGTALGVVFSAVEEGKRVRVFADETRPLLQGARLTAWECTRWSVPVTVLVEGAAASLLRSGKVASVMVGADRIAANGDAANKVGTCGLAVLARRFGVPFYVAAPSSTIDPALGDGSKIPIEERSADEVKMFAGTTVAPAEAEAYNPAFDVTPAELITAIITERGVFRPPFDFTDPS